MGEQLELNSDIQDVHFMPYISSANISCGAHSGTPSIIEHTVRLAIEHGLRLGAHPSYPDTKNFGRKSMNLTSTELYDTLSHQLAFLQRIVDANQSQIEYVKPHGALYNDLVNNEEKAIHFIRTIRQINPNLKIMGLANSPFKILVEHAGLEFISEAFADRKYAGKLKLKSRSENGALLKSEDQVIDQLKTFLDHELIDEQGILHKLHMDSICFHSDTPNALNLLKVAYEFLKSNQITIASD